jgi:hypothetical protein
MQEQIGTTSYLDLALARLPVYDGAAGVQNSSQKTHLEPVADLLDLNGLAAQGRGYKMLPVPHQLELHS